MEIEYNLVNRVQTLEKSDVPGNGAKNLFAPYSPLAKGENIMICERVKIKPQVHGNQV